jgi:glycosyltransferase involved in cell wall biosynthesis
MRKINSNCPYVNSQQSNQLRIALLGNRGIPANFGGSDTVIEQLGERLVAKGHHVSVYCRKHFSTTNDKYYKGIERVVLPSINRFNLDTITHAFLSTIHALITNKADILNYHGIGNSLVLPLLIFSSKKAVILIDGPDWKRPKWNWFAKIMLRWSVNFALWFADELISDNIPIHQWFEEKFNKVTPVIYYGADFDKVPSGENLAKWGLKGNDYILFVGMMVPDKGPDIILEAYTKLKTDLKMLMVGDTHYHKAFLNDLKNKYSSNPNVIFTGFQYDLAYREFMSNAYIYTHPFRSDGTSPSLLQALAYGNCILANSSIETQTTLQDAGLFFARDSSDSLSEKLQYLIEHPNQVETFRMKAFKFAQKKYNWDVVVQQYEEVFYKLLYPKTIR